MSNDNDGFSVILLLVYLWPIWLLLITYFTGRHIERKHYADIEAREAALRHIMVIAVKKPDLRRISAAGIWFTRESSFPAIISAVCWQRSAIFSAAISAATKPYSTAHGAKPYCA